MRRGSHSSSSDGSSCLCVWVACREKNARRRWKYAMRASTWDRCWCGSKRRKRHESSSLFSSLSFFSCLWFSFVRGSQRDNNTVMYNRIKVNTYSMRETQANDCTIRTPLVTALFLLSAFRSSPLSSSSFNILFIVIVCVFLGLYSCVEHSNRVTSEPVELSSAFRLKEKK